MDEVRAIAQSIVELNTMMEHLSILIQEQVEQLDEIEVGVDSMTGKIKRSQKDIRDAIEQLKQARRKKVQIITIVSVTAVILLFVAIGVIYYYSCKDDSTTDICWKTMLPHHT